MGSSDGEGVKKLPIALALLAAGTFALTACDDDRDEPLEPPATVVTPVPSASLSKSPVPYPSASVSVSVSPSVSVSVKTTDTKKNDVPGDGGI